MKMPWTAKEFKKKHNKKLTDAQARKAILIANAVLKQTGDEAKRSESPMQRAKI